MKSRKSESTRCPCTSMCTWFGHYAKRFDDEMRQRSGPLEQLAADRSCGCVLGYSPAAVSQCRNEVATLAAVTAVGNSMKALGYMPQPVHRRGHDQIPTWTTGVSFE